MEAREPIIGKIFGQRKRRPGSGPFGGRFNDARRRIISGGPKPQEEETRELTEEPEVLQRRIDDFEALLARYAESEAAQLD
ncbi:hypothetical protein NLJ89_g7742 [Agrocybe chaxingu]|uniref:Uncharacterized protein n=1 Tax=Agrocybe chaxingu TaxID=84603 RepID=A0A9W8MUS0_9AGAR|nr:hypothetical protein NLJ89_g7742 [Agrocybe chaxingu]